MQTLIRITQDPSVMGGKPCIRGLRITVGTIVGLVAARRSEDEILRLYPSLVAEDISEALAHAAAQVKEPTKKAKPRFAVRQRTIIFDGNSHRIPTDALELERFLVWLRKECERIVATGDGATRDEVMIFTRRILRRLEGK
jgi:uncharacterized protein (DUF433 family)